MGEREREGSEEGTGAVGAAFHAGAAFDALGRVNFKCIGRNSPSRTHVCAYAALVTSRSVDFREITLW